MLIPTAARIHFGCVIVVRVFQGLVEVLGTRHTQDTSARIRLLTLTSLSRRGFRIQPVTVSGRNGRRRLKEAAWPRRPFVVSAVVGM